MAVINVIKIGSVKWHFLCGHRRWLRINFQNFYIKLNPVALLLSYSTNIMNL